MSIKLLYNDNLWKLPNEYGEVFVMMSFCFFTQVTKESYDTNMMMAPSVLLETVTHPAACGRCALFQSHTIQ